MGDLKAETDSEITAAQNQTLQTKYHARKTSQTEIDSKCRVCQKCDETIDTFYQQAQYRQERNT